MGGVVGSDCTRQAEGAMKRQKQRTPRDYLASRGAEVDWRTFDHAMEHYGSLPEKRALVRMLMKVNAIVPWMAERIERRMERQAGWKARK